MSPLELVTATVSLVSLPLLILQVHFAARAIAADHLRRKQQATLEYLVVHLRAHWTELLGTVTTALGTAVLDDEGLARLKADPQTKALVERLLGGVEHLAVGINMGVYDLELLSRASGSFLIRIYKRFEAYMRSAQLENPRAYVEFQALARKLEALRQRSSGSSVPAG